MKEIYTYCGTEMHPQSSCKHTKVLISNSPFYTAYLRQLYSANVAPRCASIFKVLYILYSETETKIKT